MLRRSATCAAALFALAGLLPARAEAQCSDWLRNVALPHLGCSPQAIGQICAGARPVPTTPYCGGTEQPAAGMGDWCQTPIGGCQIGTQAALDRACQCPSPAGMVTGWVTRQ